MHLKLLHPTVNSNFQLVCALPEESTGNGSWGWAIGLARGAAPPGLLPPANTHTRAQVGYFTLAQGRK